MIDFFQFLVAGATQGAIYALIAIGFSVIHRATNVVNFAQGEFAMMGGLGTAGAIAAGVHPAAAMALAVAGALVAAYVLDRLVVGLARISSVILLVIVTVGASIALRGIAQVSWGRNFHTIPSPVSGDPILIAGVAVQPQVLLILAATIAIIAGLAVFFQRSRFGLAMIAVAINPGAADLMGIEQRHVYLAAFLIAGLLGAVAGLLITPLALIHFESGLMFGLKGFAAAILGGLGSMPGAALGGVLLGLFEAITAGYLSSAYKDAVAFLLIIGVLVTRPQGLLGGAADGRI